MLKILFLLGMYYPKYSANGLCTKNVVDELVRGGYEVTCICNGSKKSGNKKHLDGANLYFIKPRLHQILSEKADAVNKMKYKVFLQKCSMIINKIQLLFMSLWWPFVSPIYAMRFYKKARELHITEKFDVVISVYTPFEALLAGFWLKKKYPELIFIPYYLDALAGGWGPSYFTEKNIEKHTQKWEKKIDEEADRVVSMHSSEKYHEKMALCSKKKRIFLDVPVVKEPFICNEEEPFALYAGSLNFKGRDIRKLLDIFSLISSKLEIKLLLVGPCDESKIFEQYTEQTNGKIQYLGVVSHKEVLSMEKRAKYLVNLGSNNLYTIPSKIFEYMRFGKTIISTYQLDNEPSIEYLNKYQNVIYIDERIPVEEAADKLLKEIKRNKKAHKINLEKEFYYNTPKAFLNMVKDIENDKV